MTIDAATGAQRCATCGAVMHPESAWCAQCFVATRPGTPFAAVAPAAPPVVPVYSRTQAGVSTFGLKGRIAITVATLAMLVFLLQFNPLGGIFWLVVAVPLILRDTWKRARVR